MSANPVNVFAVIGPTGVGKSSFCNLISGVNEDDPKAFPVCAGVKSCTYQTTVKRGKFMGTGEEQVVMDTPGLGDSEGRDTQHIHQMTEAFKYVKYVTAFLIMFDAGNPRMDQNLQCQLKIFVQIFGKEFLKNAVMVFNKWKYDSRSEKERKRCGVTKQGITEEYNERFRRLFGITHRIDAIFIDTRADPDDENEINAVIDDLGKLRKGAMEMAPFKCEDITAVRGFVDELQHTIKDAAEQNDMMKIRLSEIEIKKLELERTLENERRVRAMNVQYIYSTPVHDQSLNEKIKEQDDKIAGYIDQANKNAEIIGKLEAINRDLAAEIRRPKPGSNNPDDNSTLKRIGKVLATAAAAAITTLVFKVPIPL